MTLEEIVLNFRELADDLQEPYLWSDSLVESYADRAEIEACERRPLLMTSSNAELCNINITSGVSVYAKNANVREMFYSQFVTDADSTKYDIFITNIDEISFREPSWKDLDGPPKYLILDDASVQLTPEPTEAGVLQTSVSYIPTTVLSEKGSPTISEAHHFNLVYWMLHLAYSKQDSDTHNAKASIDYAIRFANYFGDPKGINALLSIRTVRENRSRGGWI